jgi:hypothetical protein
LYAPSAGGRATYGQASGFAEGFDADWRARWTEEELASSPTTYRVVEIEGGSALQAESRGGATALVRRVEIPAADQGRIAWRWRVVRSIVAARDETQRSGDDYSGRLFVMFDGDFGDSDARALCYVWAEHLAIGSVFPSPYSDRVAMVVVSGSGERRDGWVSVERDFIEDYQAFFGESPRLVTGVAILVDTDNTGAEAVMLFDRVDLDAGRSPTVGDRPAKGRVARASNPRRRG